MAAETIYTLNAMENQPLESRKCKDRGNGRTVDKNAGCDALFNAQNAWKTLLLCNAKSIHLRSNYKLDQPVSSPEPCTELIDISDKNWCSSAINAIKGVAKKCQRARER